MLHKVLVWVKTIIVSNLGHPMTEDIEELCLNKWKETGLPQGLEHFALASHKPVPHDIRCKIRVDHPDPNGYLWDLCWFFFKYLDPGFFQDGAVKERLAQGRAMNLKWRNESLETFCERRNLDSSIFPTVPEETKDPKFAKFGPGQQTRINKLIIELGDIYPATLCIVILEYLILIPITMLLFWLLQFVFDPSILIAPTILIVLMILLTDYIISQGILTKARSVPTIFVASGRLNQLLKDFKKFEKYVIESIPEFETRGFKRFRSHPSKNAYSISIVSEAVLQSPIFPTLIKSDKVVLHLEIVGENLNTSPLVIYWFDTPKSVLLAKRSHKAIEKIENWIGRMRHQIDMDSMFVSTVKKFPLDDCEKEQINLRLQLLHEHGLILKENINN